MPDCHSIHALVTSYVDGDIGAADRRLVDEHLGTCPPCHALVTAERAVRDLMSEHRPRLAGVVVPEGLRDRCRDVLSRRSQGTAPAAALEGAGPASAAGVSTWRARFVPVALVAALVLVVAGAFVYQASTRSVRVMAAELAADHVKCFGVVNPLLGTRDEPAAVEQSMRSSFGWDMRVPVDAGIGLDLVGARPCLYGGGLVAHIMYRHNGEPVSVFMLPGATRSDQTVAVLGHEASIWSAGDRTYVLIAREPRADVARLTAFVRAGLR
jgi:anti-sigma factor RsiW